MTLYEDVMSPKIKTAEPTTYHIYRDYTEDGVLGLNGKQWLNDDDDKTMEFPSVKDAIHFLDDNDIDIYEDEFIHIVNTNDKEDGCLIEHNPHIGMDEEAKEIIRGRRDNG